MEQKKISRREQKRLEALNIFENQARAQGFSLLAGIDEAGRGPLAGPVVAAACVIPENFFLKGVNDSKLLTQKQREEIFDLIVNHPQIQYGVGIVSVEEIDKINILQATIKAMLKAVEVLPSKPDFLLVDGLLLPHPSIPVKKIIKGDSLSQSIAAASVIAKVTRDHLMRDYDVQWPEYGFAQHKGYGTEKHLQALAKHGPSPIHRLTFAPIRKQEELDLFKDFSLCSEA